MARLNAAQKIGISLFPMFNILVCTLGVLIFILSSVVTISLGVDKSIVVVPESHGNSTHLKTPTFIEWDGKNLIAHLTSPVRWSQISRNMIADGATEVIEVGPGSVLQGLVKKVKRDIITSSAVMPE